VLYRVRRALSLQKHPRCVIGSLGHRRRRALHHAVKRSENYRCNRRIRSVVGALLTLFAIFSTEVGSLYINLFTVHWHGVRSVGCPHGRAGLDQVIGVGGHDLLHLRLRVRACARKCCFG